MPKHFETPPISGNVESHFFNLFYVNDKSISFMHYMTYNGILMHYMTYNGILMHYMTYNGIHYY